MLAHVVADIHKSGYLLQIAAAQKACEQFPTNQTSQILAPFDSMAAPASFIVWLQQQPKSSVVQQCLDALQQSPINLTRHLLSRYVCTPNKNVEQYMPR